MAGPKEHERALAAEVKNLKVTTTRAFMKPYLDGWRVV